MFFLGHGFENVEILSSKKKSVISSTSFQFVGLILRFGCNNTSCQGHGFKQVIILIPKKMGVLLVISLFSLGVDFKILVKGTSF
jgi:hypothetical protein